MKEQNFSNHSRLVSGFHGVLFIAVMVLFIGSIINVLNSSGENLYSASLLVLVSIILLVLMYYTRAFALKAQDRAIVAEEGLRYFILAGKPVMKELSIRQKIGLRFASDEEFVGLCEKSVLENLSEKDIKKSIKNWRTDIYRV